MYSANNLAAMNFKELDWLIPGHLCVGLGVLGGPPKVGKSSMALGMMADITLGRNTLGKLPTNQYGGLYISLELPLQQFYPNIERVLGNRAVKTEQLIQMYFEEHSTFSEEGITLAGRIESYLEKNHNLKFIVIDSLAKVLDSPELLGATSFTQDYQFLSEIQEIANDNNICIMFIHHTRKSKTTHVFDEMLGSRGVTAVPDTLMVLNPKGETGGILSFGGRHIPKSTYELECDQSTLEWEISKKQKINIELTPEREEIVAVFNKYPYEDVASSKIAEELGKTQSTVSSTLRKMKILGIVESGSTFGYYKLKDNLYDDAELQDENKTSDENKPQDTNENDEDETNGEKW